MDKFLERFSNFFVRSVAPSSIFFVLLFFNDMYFNESKLYKLLFSFIRELKEIDINLVYVILVLIFLGYGYINQILTQILDNFIKRNYEFCDYKFTKLRRTVENKCEGVKNDIFTAIDFNDYNAYQVLGKDIKVSTSYVDEVKNIHTFCVALILNLLIYTFYFSLLTYLKCLIILIILIITFHYLAKSRYKARNKRLYINYLLKEDKPNKQEKEIKIKSIKVEVDE